MKRIGDAEFFDGKCPYTGKPCNEWECNACEVEEQEKEAMRAIDIIDKCIKGDVE